MPNKLVLADLTTLSASSAVTILNNNFTDIENAVENTLSRDGTSPNHMLSNLDMNSFRIENLVAAISDTEPVRLREFLDGLAVLQLEIDTVALGLIGPQGPMGFTGDVGPQGPPGFSGSDGVQGDIGPPGIQGETGSQGIQGIQGVQGIPGVQGEDGQDGTIGVQGIQGIQGSTGPQGANGSDGVPGQAGDEGEPGPIGPQGLTGATGASGSAGATGSQGPPGVQGDEGSEGSIGPPGIQGNSGIQGIPGIDGYIGPTGQNGEEGPIGPPGLTGPQGPAGASGSGSTATGVLNFGSFPGSSVTSVDIVAVGVISTSVINAWIRPVASADHTDIDHVAAPMRVIGKYLSDGNIRVYGINTNDVIPPPVLIHRQPQEATIAGRNYQSLERKISPMFVGQYNVNISWS